MFYRETFTSFLPKAYKHQTGFKYSFVFEHVLTRELPDISATRKCMMEAHNNSREATTKVIVPSVERRFISVSRKWFCQYITTKLVEFLIITNQKLVKTVFLGYFLEQTLSIGNLL